MRSFWATWQNTVSKNLKVHYGCENANNIQSEKAPEVLMAHRRQQIERGSAEIPEDAGHTGHAKNDQRGPEEQDSRRETMRTANKQRDGPEEAGAPSPQQIPHHTPQGRRGNHPTPEGWSLPRRQMDPETAHLHICPAEDGGRTMSASSACVCRHIFSIHHAPGFLSVRALPGLQPTLTWPR